MRAPARPLDSSVPLYCQICALQNNREETAGCVDAHEYHDTDDDASIDRAYGDAQQKEADADFDQANRKEVDGLCDEVQLVASGKVYRINVLDMPPCAVANLGNNDDLAYDTLECCQFRAFCIRCSGCKKTYGVHSARSPSYIASHFSKTRTRITVTKWRLTNTMATIIT